MTEATSPDPIEQVENLLKTEPAAEVETGDATADETEQKTSKKKIVIFKLGDKGGHHEVAKAIEEELQNRIDKDN